MTASQQFEEIIANARIDDLLLFFQNLDKREYPELKKTLKKLYSQLQKRGFWNSTDRLKNMLQMSGLVLSNQQEFNSMFWPITAFNYCSDKKQMLDFWEISKPTWITDYLDSKGTGVIDYELLQTLYEIGIIQHNEGLFARSVANITGIYNEKFRTSSAFDEGKSGYPNFENYVLNNTSVYKRDLPLIFENVTNVHDEVTMHINFESRMDINRCDKSWQNVIGKLIELNHWNKQETLQKCLESLKKDWKQNLTNWFKTLYLSLSPSNDETLILQTELCYLLSLQQPSIVNFAAAELKKISLEKEFDKNAFLEMSVSILHRSDCKTAIKTVLGIYEKLALKTENQSQICQNACNCLLIDDLAIQEKAIKIIEKYGDVNDVDFCQNLAALSSNLKGDLKKHISKFLVENKEIEAKNIEIVEKYEVLPQNFQRIRADNAIQIPDNWNDFMFHIGKVLSAENLAIDIEIFLQAFDNLYDTFPADYKTQLKPYTKQTEGGNSGMTMALFCGFINHWTSDQNQSDFKHNRKYKSTPDNIKRLRGRFRQLYRKQIEHQKQPFMAAVTHTPHWISPMVFVERLLWYQENNQQPEMYDMCVGICRIALENCESALELAQKLNEKERIFVEFFLGNGPMPSLENDENQDIFTVLAARTKNPTGYFPEFESLPCANYPNVVKPFELKFTIEKKLKDYSKYYYNILKVEIGAKKELDSKFLNDLDNYKYESLWENRQTIYDFEILYHQIPNFSDPLYLELARQCKMPDSEDTSPNVVALNLMFEKGFVFRNIHIFFLAQMSMNVKKVSRNLVSEILIHTIQNQAIDVDLLANYIGQLVSKNYASLQRPLETLSVLKDVSPLHNIALKSIYEGIIEEICKETEILKNTKKILEDYFDVLIKTKSKPNENLIKNLKIWSDNATLKKIAKSILEMAGAL